MSREPVSQTQSSAYSFSTRELARLAMYRAAIVARFYTDECELPFSGPELESAHLFGTPRSDAQAA